MIIRNTSDSGLYALTLTTLQDSGVRVRFADSLIANVPRGAAAATTMFVSRDSGGKRPTAIVVRVDYRTGRKGSPGVTLGTVRLVPDRLETPDQAAQVRLSSSAGTLTEREPGRVYVIVANKTDLPLEVRRIQSRGPVFTEVDTSLGGRIPPHGVEAFEINLRTKQRVQPGKHTLVFDVLLAWTSMSGPRTGNVVLPHEVDVGVFGESAVLKVLSVPSFMLLPGFLMIAAFALVLQYKTFGRGGKTAELSLKATSIEFWVLAITLSGLMALLYPRGYLGAYGTRDLVEVWLVSVVLGAVAGAIWYGWTYVWNTPSAKDSPVKVLRKMGRQGLGIDAERVQIDGGETRYLLQRMPQEGPVWVGPPIALTWLPGANTSEDRTQFNTLRRERQAKPLADFLEKAQARNAIRVTWKPDNATPMRISNPTPAGSGLIIEKEEG